MVDAWSARGSSLARIEGSYKYLHRPRSWFISSTMGCQLGHRGAKMSVEASSELISQLGHQGAEISADVGIHGGYLNWDTL